MESKLNQLAKPSPEAQIRMLSAENEALREYRDHVFDYAHKNLSKNYLGQHIAKALVQEHAKLQAENLKLRAGLEFYATLAERKYDEPNLRREFGCGCCAGTNNAEGDCDYDREVVGLTARETLNQIDEGKGE